jgi:uncharacterized protein (DUF1778 family)
MKRQVAFTLRFDPAFYERIKAVAASRGRSVTSFVQEAVTRKMDEEAAASLFQAFTLVGEDMTETSVEFAHNAQQEVALKDV